MSHSAGLSAPVSIRLNGYANADFSWRPPVRAMLPDDPEGLGRYPSPIYFCAVGIAAVRSGQWGPTGVGSPCSLTIYRTAWCRVALAVRHLNAPAAFIHPCGVSASLSGHDILNQRQPPWWYC